MANHSPEQLELLVLSAMYQGTPEGSLRAEAAKRLANYRWREPVHAAIFGCLAVLPSLNPGELRLALLTCLTRKGFPDVDTEILFPPHGVSRDQARQIIGRLIESC